MIDPLQDLPGDVRGTRPWPMEGAPGPGPARDNDPVNHPSHYTDGQIEVIDFIEDKKLSYHLGNTVKYICRAGKKDPAKTIEDLEKALWYLARHINNLKMGPPKRVGGGR